MRVHPEQVGLPTIVACWGSALPSNEDSRQKTALKAQPPQAHMASAHPVRTGLTLPLRRVKATLLILALDAATATQEVCKN